MAEDMGIWLYAVAGRIDPGWLDGLAAGVGGRPVRTVEAGGLTAAVTSVSLEEFGEAPLRRNLEDLPWLETVARGHHQVIAAVARHTPVIPMRLAIVYREEAGVARLLTARRENFAESLEKITAKAEWGVKVYLAEPSASPSPAPLSPPPVSPVAARSVPADAAARPAAGSGTAYLLRRRQQLSAAEDTRRAAAASAETIHASLAGLASAAELRPPQGTQLSGRTSPMILNAAYLVPDERADDFTVSVDRLAARHPAVVVERTGPWPPYSFASVNHE